jgi:diguanylate cyclase (GGDEF)-like protein/PAS domain S-box-containing protein
MSKQLGKHFVRLVFALKQQICLRKRELITATIVAVCVLLLRSIGLLQSLELTALDQFFQLRPPEGAQDLITIVAIDEVSLRQVGSWPIPDETIAQLLQKLALYRPRAIGLDIYRDLAVEPGHQDLVDVYRALPNLVGIELLSNNKNISVSPPPTLSQLDQVGFNNVLLDSDGRVRRSLLYWHVDNQAHKSFALKLALLYLKSVGVLPKHAESNPEYLQLGKAVFRRLQSNDGPYVGLDNKGYQILSNFLKIGCQKSSFDSCGFRKVSLREVLADRVPENWLKDRIVLIGSTAPSLQDFVLIPYSSRLIGSVKPIAGVELQAYFIGEFIKAAVEGRPVLNAWLNPQQECVWIFAWAYVGSLMRWRIQHVSMSVISILLLCFVLTSGAYLSFLFGWWIPIIPALLTYSCSSIIITYQIASQQEELRRSKEFLDQVINTIADPIFVKNEKYQWIVLNEAYCQLIGYTKSTLIEKSDYDFFPKHEADSFQEQDALVFRSQKPLEHEEEFTDATGKTHFIATKRSLHKDAAGNCFLVGVIRDITERKRIEEELKRSAAELFRSNKELKIQEDHFRYLAYHDPLTGLPNRKFFVEQLQESVQWSQKNNFLLGLLFIDLDGFKQVNDTLGHEIGDRLLVIVGKRLSNCLRGSDTVSRLGGDEFTVILRAIPKVQAVSVVAEKILATIHEPIVLSGHTIKVSASIGISIYPINSQDSETLIKQADVAMYSAKHLGKNRYEYT